MVRRGSFSQVELALASPSELGCSVRWMQRSDANLPERRPGRWGQGITPAVMKRCIWVELVLVAQVKFTERTGDNQLRQPVFLGLRTDKNQRKSYVNEMLQEQRLQRQRVALQDVELQSYSS